MADYVDQWSAEGRENIFGNQVKVVEMQSKQVLQVLSTAPLAAGALTTHLHRFSGPAADDPDMYKIAAEQLPCVFDVSRVLSLPSL